MIKNKKTDSDGKTREPQKKYPSTFIIDGVVCDEEYLETPNHINIRKVWTKAHLYCYYQDFRTGKSWDKYMDVHFLSIQASITLWHRIGLYLNWNHNNKIYDLTLSDYGLRSFQTIINQFGREYQGRFITVEGVLYRTNLSDSKANAFDIFVKT